MLLYTCRVINGVMDLVFHEYLTNAGVTTSVLESEQIVSKALFVTLGRYNRKISFPLQTMNNIIIVGGLTYYFIILLLFIH